MGRGGQRGGIGEQKSRDLLLEASLLPLKKPALQKGEEILFRMPT